MVNILEKHYLKKITISNMARIVHVDIDPPKIGIVAVTGPNAAGKTSLLKTIVAGLGAKMPQLREGENKGSIEIETEKYKVKTIVTPKGNRCIVTDTNNNRIKSPKTLLKQLFGKRCFDAKTFLDFTPQKQLDSLLSVITIPGEIEKIREITQGKVLFNMDDNIITWINTAWIDITAERRIINRQIKDRNGVIACFPTIITDKEISLEPLYKLKDKARQKEIVKDRIKIQQQLLENIQKQIQELEIKYNVEDERLCTLENELTELKPYIIEEIEEEIRTVKLRNENIIKYKEKIKAQKELQQYQKTSAELTVILNKIGEYKQKLIRETNMPLEEMDIKQGQIFYKGHPLSVASGAEQLLIACAIAIKEIPTEGIQALFVFDPPQLDTNSWNTLNNFAQKNKVQLWIATIDNNNQSACQIELFEGVQKKENVNGK